MVRIRYHQSTFLTVRNIPIENFKYFEMALRKSNLSKKIKNFNKSFKNELNKGRFVGGENVIRLEEKLKNEDRYI